MQQMGKDRMGELAAALESTDAEVRERAVRAIGDLGDPEAGQFLSPLVRYGQRSVGGGKGDSESVQLAAIEALGRLGGPHALDAFASVLGAAPPGSAVPWVHQATIRALTVMAAAGYQEDAAALLARFFWKGGQHPAVHHLVIDCLGEIGHSAGIEPLRGLLRFYSTFSFPPRADVVRITRALAQISAKSRDVRSLVGSLLEGSTTPEERAAAATALGTVGGSEAVHALITALADPWGEVREAAAKALGRVGPDAIPAVASALNHGHDRHEREYSAMMQHAGMRNHWGDDRQEKFVRQYAAIALGEIGGDAAVLELISALKGSYSWVKPDSAKALAKIGGTRAIGALRDALPSADPIMRVEITRVLEVSTKNLS